MRTTAPWPFDTGKGLGLAWPILRRNRIAYNPSFTRRFSYTNGRSKGPTGEKIEVMISRKSPTVIRSGSCVWFAP